MHYLVYRTTCSVNGKVYVGVHVTNDIEDGYLGSGLAISRAIKKHGRDKFTREILHDVTSAEEAYQLEAQIVNEQFVERDDTYNLRTGGLGGWSHQHTAETKERMRQSHLALPPREGKPLTESHREAIRAGQRNSSKVNEKFLREQNRR